MGARNDKGANPPFGESTPVNFLVGFRTICGFRYVIVQYEVVSIQLSLFYLPFNFVIRLLIDIQLLRPEFLSRWLIPAHSSFLQT